MDRSAEAGERWGEVCMLAAMLMFESDGEVPALSAIGQATRMAGLKTNQATGANEDRS